MIYRIRWLWKQFTGKIVSSFATGIFRVVSSIDDTISYLNTLSVATANDSHLTIISLFMGLTRPVLSLFPETYFWFTRQKESGNIKGFSDLADLSVGGQFTDLYDPRFTVTKTSAPASLWRPILQATIASTAQIGSAKWIDDMISVCTDPNHTPYSRYTWWKPGQSTTRAPGDIEVLLGWEDSYGSVGTFVREMLALSTNNYLNPEWYVDFNFGVYGREEEVILGTTTKYSYGAISAYLGYYEDTSFDTPSRTLAVFRSLMRDIFRGETVNIEGIDSLIGLDEDRVLAVWQRPYNDDEGAIQGLTVTEGKIVQTRDTSGELAINVALEYSSVKQQLGTPYVTPKNVLDTSSLQPAADNTAWGLCYVVQTGSPIPEREIGAIELFWDNTLKCSYLRIQGHTAPLYSLYWIVSGESAKDTRTYSSEYFNKLPHYQGAISFINYWTSFLSLQWEMLCNSNFEQAIRELYTRVSITNYIIKQELLEGWQYPFYCKENSAGASAWQVTTCTGLKTDIYKRAYIVNPSTYLSPSITYSGFDEIKQVPHIKLTDTLTLRWYSWETQATYLKPNQACSVPIVQIINDEGDFLDCWLDIAATGSSVSALQKTIYLIATTEE